MSEAMQAVADTLDEMGVTELGRVETAALTINSTTL
jgi:hypothetical protein